MDTIGWDDFARVELRVGRVLSAEVFAQARKPVAVTGWQHPPASPTHTNRPCITSRGMTE